MHIQGNSVALLCRTAMCVTDTLALQFYDLDTVWSCAILWQFTNTHLVYIFIMDIILLADQWFFYEYNLTKPLR